MTMVEYLSKKNNVPASLRAINSAILSGTRIIIGYTTDNLRFGKMAENYLHIGGKSVYWPIGYADPSWVGEELRQHAAEMGREVRLGYSATCKERGQMGTIWWSENSHLNRFEITERLPWEWDYHGQHKV